MRRRDEAVDGGHNGRLRLIGVARPNDMRRRRRAQRRRPWTSVGTLRGRDLVAHDVLVVRRVIATVRGAAARGRTESVLTVRALRRVRGVLLHHDVG